MNYSAKMFVPLLCLFGLYSEVESFQKRIIGAATMDSNKTPWAATLVFDNKDDMGLCGATIINARWLLTAAHCFLRTKQKDHWSVYVGYNKIDLKDTKFPTGPWGAVINKAIHLKVEQVVPHPDFDLETGKNDIGLVKLATALPMQVKSIAAVSLPPAKFIQPATGFTGEIAASGCIRYGKSYPGYGTYAKFQVMSRYRCLKAYPDLPGGEFCAGGIKTGAHICDGDSGSGIVFNNPRAPYVGGVVSYAEDNTDAVFTNVALHKKWIGEVQRKFP